MDENNNVVYNPPNNDQSAGNQPATQDSPRITVQDLYGPSASQPPQPVEQSVSEPSPPVTQTDVAQPDSTQQPTEEILPPPLPQEETSVEQPLPQASGPAEPPPPDVPPDSMGGNLPDSAPPMAGPLRSKILKMVFGGIGILVVLALLIGGVSRFFSGDKKYNNATITYWGLWEDAKTLKPIIDDFEKKYPGIKVVYEKRDKKQYKDRVLGRTTTNTAPDVFTYHNTWVPTLQEVLLPLPSDVVTLDDFKATYYPVVLDDLVLNGAIYGIPQGIDTLTLFVNRQIFNAAQIQIPQTWDQFSIAAKTMTTKDNNKITISGAAMGAYDNINHAADIVSLLFLQSGMKFDQLAETSDSMVAALRFYTPFASSSDRTWDPNDKTNTSMTAFAKGKVGFYFGFSWDIFSIQKISKENGVNLKFDLYPVPYIPKHDKMTIASYWVNGVSKKSQHQKEALLFLKYLSEKDVVQKLYTESSKTRAFGTPYARKDLAESLKNNPMVYRFIEQAPYAKSSYFASDTYDDTFTEDLNEYLSRAIQAIFSYTSIESAVSTIINGVKTVFTKNGIL